jgi:hypothetical protein
MNIQHEEERIINILSKLYRNNIEDVKIAELIINDYSEEFLERVISMTYENRLLLL